MKLIMNVSFFFCFLFLCSCSKKVISTANVKTQLQLHDFELGSLPMRVELDKVYYYKNKDRYFLKGVLRGLSQNHWNDTGRRIYGAINLVHNGDTSFLYNISNTGRFKVFMKKDDSLIFSSNEDQYLNVYVYMKK